MNTREQIIREAIKLSAKVKLMEKYKQPIFISHDLQRLSRAVDAYEPSIIR